MNQPASSSPAHPGAIVLKDLVPAIGVLGLTALALTGAIWLTLPHWYPQARDSVSRPSIESLPGALFSVVDGREASQDGNARVVGDLERNRVVFLTRTMFRAARYSALRLDLSGVHPDLRTELYWRTFQKPGEYHYLPLKRGAEDTTWHLLAGEEGWEGQIMEVGVVLSGLHASQPMRLESLQFRQTSRAVLGRILWQDWRVFSPWRQGSANSYAGYSDDAAFSPVAVASLWMLGSLFGLAAVGRVRRWRLQRALVPGLFVIMVPWLFLDSLWQHRLGDQLAATQQRFGAMSQADKRQMEDDAGLRRQAQSILESLAPIRGKRVFLLRDDVTGHDFHRLRLQYHLLPLNVYNFGKRLPAPEHARTGDYVLLLDEPEQVIFESGQGELRDGRNSLPASLVERQPRMSLYRLQIARDMQ